MPGASRLGDMGSGHASWPPRPNDEASTDVFVNSIGSHRQGDHWATHCNPQPECHDSTLAAGSSTVYVNGKQMSRIGDPIACGSTITEGSTNVFVGG